MEVKQFLFTVNRKKGAIFLIIVIFLVTTAIFTFSQPLKYEANSKLLLVQNFGSAVDPYTASKSNEYLSDILASVTTSDYFFRDVMNAGFNIDQSYFPERADKKIKMWQKTVSAKSINDTGIIAISVYHPDKYQLEQIARAVNYVLKTKNSQYHGGGDRVSVKTIDEPIISNWPTKPNVFLNFGLAMILGLVFGLNYVYLFPEIKQSSEFWPSVKKSKEARLEKNDLLAVAEVVKKTLDDYNHISQHVDVQKTSIGYENEARETIHKDYRGSGDMKNIFG